MLAGAHPMELTDQIGIIIGIPFGFTVLRDFRRGHAHIVDVKVSAFFNLCYQKLGGIHFKEGSLRGKIIIMTIKLSIN